MAKNLLLLIYRLIESKIGHPSVILEKRIEELTNKLVLTRLALSETIHNVEESENQLTTLRISGANSSDLVAQLEGLKESLCALQAEESNIKRELDNLQTKKRY